LVPVTNLPQAAIGTSFRSSQTMEPSVLMYVLLPASVVTTVLLDYLLLKYRHFSCSVGVSQR
jgi:hypothetical protein